MEDKKGFDWKAAISRTALVLLALSACYGVYRFSTIFVPGWVALLTACAFEGCYIGLAFLPNLTEAQKKTANRIAIWAVFVSLVYNTLAAVAELTPKDFDKLEGWAVWVLSGLHGIPLAVTGYFMANLLLHSEGKAEQEAPTFDNSALVTLVKEIVKVEAESWQLTAKEQDGVTALLTGYGSEIDKEPGQELTIIAPANSPEIDNNTEGETDKPRRRTRKKAEIDHEAQQSEIAKLGRALRDKKISTADFDTQLAALLTGSEG